MTGAEFSGVDVDLLADYVGGALDGTPDEAVVTALIAEDPAWHDAYALLCGGVEAVSTELRTLGSTPEPMPADIFARLDAALLEASATRGSSPDAGTGSADSTQGARHDPVDADDPGGARVIAIGTARERASGRGTAAPGAPASDGATPDQRPVAVPFDARRRRTRRLRGAAGVGIAAGVLAFAGFGAQQLAVSTDSQTASSAGSAADRAADQGAPQSAELAVPGVPPMQITESGLDYRQATLGQAGAHTLAAPNASDADKLDGSRSSASAPTAKSETTDALSRLRVQAALIACIDAIADKSGLAPITAQSVDFARYDGAPAVIIQFAAPGGSWVWAVGPGCGASGVGADKLGSVQVG
ncbi:hypothetical protein ACFQFC_24010 [Amorphoplanes digitatis]|uniref:Uncharacterized protein n=1 Tax=Actinoplanes digitatis TaxID=1868 RepID=A0A7W7MV11_9ACTN|nr:hypothetical protein [Actinoplanes digitatis]MBB4767287.1 hypothetical protein [Actinoplanes digitatis]GID98288.1 hypothetical protein Adi01nite_77000 [Actinoplanes digitatis]